MIFEGDVMKFLWYMVLSGGILLGSTNQIHAQAKKAKRPDSPAALEPPKAEPTKPPAKPKVHSILKQACPYKFGLADTLACAPLEYVEYHPSGRILKFLKFEDAEIVWRTYFKYDNAANKIEELLFDGDSLLNSRTTFMYDAKGNLIEEAKYDGEGALRQKLARRYEGGKLIEEILYDRDGQIEKKLAHAYDATGNKLESSHFSGDGDLETKETFVYDAKKNKISQSSYDSDGKLKSKTTYKYDPAGHLIEEATYESDGSVLLRLEYRYDTDGNKTEFARFAAEGKLELREKYSYAGKNRVEAAVYNSADEFMNKTTYAYDKNGTLEREVEHDKLNEPQRMIRYVINYFP
jgi:hypothetical protein